MNQLPKTWLLVTGNAGKAREWEALLTPLGITLKTLRDIGYTHTIEETGDTFAANSEIKVKALEGLVSMPILADDSGLCVDCIGGAPGVYSARYAGEGASDAQNREKLLLAIKDQTMRTAYYLCDLCLSLTHGAYMHFEGRCMGTIATQEKGTQGFGYDSIFIPQGYTYTFAEISLQEKLPLSHRYQSIQKLFKAL